MTFKLQNRVNKQASVCVLLTSVTVGLEMGRSNSDCRVLDR